MFRIVLICLCLIGCSPSMLKVEKVISADTIILSDGTQVHYAGLQAPGEDHPWGEFSRVANAYLVQDKEVKLQWENDHSAYIYTPIDVGKETKFLFVNAEIARFGFSEVLPVPQSAQYPELWQNLWQLQEREAKPNKKGIWSDQPPKGEFNGKQQ